MRCKGHETRGRCVSLSEYDVSMRHNMRYMVTTCSSLRGTCLFCVKKDEPTNGSTLNGSGPRVAKLMLFNCIDLGLILSALTYGLLCCCLYLVAVLIEVFFKYVISCFISGI